MKILFIGDIVGRLGRATTKKTLPSISESDNISLFLANAENLAHGRGATVRTIEEMRQIGIDYFTSGEHIFRHEGFDKEIDSLPVLRPANFTGVAGKGYTLVGNVLLINLIGQTFIGVESRNPFEVADGILNEFKGEKLSAIIVDFHAEATSEKIALGHYLDGRVSAVLGTHTHVPTADARILPNGTAFISDIGMVGSLDSVIGVKKEIIIDRFVNDSKDRFEWETKGPTSFNSVLLDIDESSGKAVNIERIDKVIG